MYFINCYVLFNEGSPKHVFTRRSWNSEEQKEAQDLFSKHIANKRLPSTKECQTSVAKNSTLQNRTPMQLKLWVNNQIKKNQNVHMTPLLSNKSTFVHV